MVHIYDDLAYTFDHLIKSKTWPFLKEGVGHKRSLEDSWSLELEQGRSRRIKGKEAKPYGKEGDFELKDLVLARIFRFFKWVSAAMP